MWSNDSLHIYNQRCVAEITEGGSLRNGQASLNPAVAGASTSAERWFDPVYPRVRPMYV